MSTCACAPRQHTAVHKNSPMTLFSSSLCPNAVCRDTVYNISGKTDDLLSNAELHKNKTIQKKNTEESPYSWIWVPTVLQSTEAIKDLQGAGLFHCACRWETAITSGEAHKGVWIFTCYFAEKNINTINISAVYSLCLSMPRVTSSRLQWRWVIWWQQQRRGGDGSPQRPRPPRGSSSNGRR